MLRKIISIKNVGRFRSSAGPGNPQLAKHTLIVGANGFGKTTICSVLRSLQTGESAHILGRKTLGADASATVELLLAAGAARFDGANWDRTHPETAIFDGVFVAENVHSGDVVDIAQKRNLYRVIIGQEGVSLATQDTDLASASRAKTSEISTTGKAILANVPSGMTVEEFLALAGENDIDAKIVEQERAVEAARQTGAINARASLAEFPVPIVPDGLDRLLISTIEDVSSDAERLLVQHLTTHRVERGWVAAGVERAGESCPFCGQEITDLPIIAAFRAAFSDRYRTHVGNIKEMQRRIEDLFGEIAISKIETINAKNCGDTEFWSRYCTITVPSISLPADVSEAAKVAGLAAHELLRRKAASPLDPVTPDEAFRVAIATLGNSLASLDSVNREIRSANARIAEKKAATGASDVLAADRQLSHLRAVKSRHEGAMAALCSKYATLISDKNSIDSQKETVRTLLDTHTKSVVRPYENSINRYLVAFNAGFSISETRHAYPGGVATSSYQLVINEIPIDVGDGKTPIGRPSFKNTLSAGDRTTLALALFLAHLARDPAIASKIVVFDDPFNSQDAFRRRQTVHEIMKVAASCAQVIVLSHDATFIKQVWDKAPPAERVALAIVDHRAQGSKIMPVDLERACQGRTATDIDDLQSYLTTGAGTHIDIIRKMRGVLETHCRTTYPSSFLANDWLGGMVGKIRDGGDTHPAQALYNELDQINDYTSQYHHGQDYDDATPDDIDPNELAGCARRTLRIVNALQA